MKSWEDGKSGEFIKSCAYGSGGKHVKDKVEGMMGFSPRKLGRSEQYDADCHFKMLTVHVQPSRGSKVHFKGQLQAQNIQRCSTGIPERYIPRMPLSNLSSSGRLGLSIRWPEVSLGKHRAFGY